MAVLSGKYEQVTDYITRIGIPVPFPMKYVYCYLFRQEKETILIDVGFPTTEAKEHWEQVFVELGVNPREITKIILTHFHPDHTGLISWMQQTTGAAVYMSEEEEKMIRTVFGGSTTQAVATYEMFQKHAVPEPLLSKIRNNVLYLSMKVNPLPEIRILKDSYLDSTDGKWLVQKYAGHAEGHLCFYHENRKFMLIGDVILNKITPNISLWPNSDQNPLGSYFKTLSRLMKQDVSKAYPAHGTPIDDVAKRAGQIVQHHHNRLNSIISIMETKQTTFEITEDLFKHKELTDHQWRFAIAETLAHLEYLVVEKRINKTEENGIFLYKLKAESKM